MNIPIREGVMNIKESSSIVSWSLNFCTQVLSQNGLLIWRLHTDCGQVTHHRLGINPDTSVPEHFQMYSVQNYGNRLRHKKLAIQICSSVYGMQSYLFAYEHQLYFLNINLTINQLRFSNKNCIRTKEWRPLKLIKCSSLLSLHIYHLFNK